jgi:hypothetical protein
MDGLYHSLKTGYLDTISKRLFRAGGTKSYVYTSSFPLGRCNVYTNVLLELIYCKNFLMV